MKQLDLFLNRGHGGKRAGAGRPRRDNRRQLHIPRSEFKPNQPLHVTIGLVYGLPNLRHGKYFQLFKLAVIRAKSKGLKIIHFSVQGNHIHLLIESESKQTLAAELQSFCTSLARRMNLILKRSGQVFRDRYHLHVLKTAREVKNALIYIFQNFAKHSNQPNRFDPRSTLICFKDRETLGLLGIKVESHFSIDGADRVRKELEGLISLPVHWLLTTGWKRAG